MPSTRAPSPRAVERKLLELLAGRESSICPSEVARALAPTEFRALMQPVRDAAARLMARGVLEITQRGRVVEPPTRGPIRLRRAAKSGDPYRGVDFRKHPERYVVGRGERGVLTAEPYKSELLPLWRFRTAAVARGSAAALYAKFVEYRRAGDFVGMDMARKYLQMGFTRARRYANHKSGRKYDARGEVLPREEDAEKAAAARIFKRAWDRVEGDATYRRLRRAR